MQRVWTDFRNQPPLAQLLVVSVSGGLGMALISLLFGMLIWAGDLTRESMSGHLRPLGDLGQATALRNTLVAQVKTNAHSGMTTANACHTWSSDKAPAVSAREPSTT